MKYVELTPDDELRVAKNRLLELETAHFLQALGVVDVKYDLPYPYDLERQIATLRALVSSREDVDAKITRRLWPFRPRRATLEA